MLQSLPVYPVQSMRVAQQQRPLLTSLTARFTRQPIMEEHCGTGAAVPLGTCSCWDAVDAARRVDLKSDLTAWVTSFRAAHPDFAR